jgi:ELWxxDGT repeat protein
MGFLNSFLACSKKDDAKTPDSGQVTEEAISSIESVDTSGGGAIDVGGIGSSTPTPPLPFSAQIGSNLGSVKVSSELTCDGSTSSSSGGPLSYERVWLQSTSIDGPWASFSGIVDQVGKIALTSDHAHLFLKCRIRAIDQAGLATLASSNPSEIVDSLPTAVSVSFSTAEEVSVPVSLSLGTGYADLDLDSLVSVTSGTVFGGTLASWVCSGGVCNNTFTPNLNFSGMATFEYTVATAYSSSPTPAVGSVSVSEINDAPVISQVSDQITQEDTDLIGVPFTIADVEETLNCQTSVSVSTSNASLIPLSGIILSGTSPNCLLRLNPNSNQSGTAQITLSVTDSALEMDSNSFQVSVSSVNDAPTLALIADQLVNEDQFLDLSFSTADVDSTLNCTTAMSYVSGNTSILSNSSGVSFSGVWPNCSVRITPRSNAFGTVSVVLTVSDGSGTASRTFDLVVAPVNDAPVISQIVDQSTNEDSPINGLTFSIADIDSTLTCSGSVSGSSSNTLLMPDSSIVVTGAAPNCILSLTPDLNQFGSSTVSLTVTDDSSATNLDSFVFTVSPVNDSPSPVLGVALNALEGLYVGKSVSCLGTSTDVDGDALTYTNSFEVSSSDLGPWNNALGTVNGSGQLTIAKGDAHKYIRCKRAASDGQGGFAEAISDPVEILDSNVVAQNMTVAGTEDEVLELTINAGVGLGYLDADGDKATAITVDSLSSGSLDGDFVCETTGVCTVSYTPDLNFNGAVTFAFTVYNDFGSSEERLFTINLASVNDTPYLSGTSNLPIEKSQLYSLSMAASDPDGDVLTATCQAQCPTGLSFSGTTLNWTPAEDELGSRTILIRVTDSGGLYNEDTFMFTVVDTVPPETPSLTSMTVIPPSNNLIFNLLGTAESSTNIHIYKSEDCSGSVLANLPADTFNTSGAEISLSLHEIYTRYSAVSVDGSSNSSACSAPFAFTRAATSIAQFPGAEGSSAPERAIEHQGKFYFAADNFINGRELWVYDPALGTSTLLVDLELSGSSSPTNLASIGDYVYFSAYTTASGREPYRTDGTSGGTIRLADFCTGTCSSNPGLSVALNGQAYFAATRTGSGTELMVSDGSVSGTALFKDIRAGSSSSSPLSLTVISNKIWMQATGASGGIELYVSDGTSAGTNMVLDIHTSGNSSPSNFAPVAGGVIFQATTAASGAELWFSDGTAGGTSLVLDIAAGSTSSTPSNMVVHNGKVYFAATTSASGRELWMTDGTASGTSMVVDINAGSASSNPTTIIPALGKLLFQATTAAAGQEPWLSDGTAAGTAILRDIRSGTSGSVPNSFAATSTRIYMSADTNANRELWVSDGTTVGTVQYDIYSGSSGFTGSTYWITSTSFGALFQGTNATVGSELFRFNESGSTVALASNIAQPGVIVPRNLVMMNGVAYFVADDGVNGSELWSYNGSAASLVLDICPGSCSSSIGSLMAWGTKLYFSATTTAAGSEPWVSDGTGAGTFMLSNLSTTTGSSAPSGFVGMGSTVYFVAQSSAAGRELYKTDGTGAGTVIVRDIRSGTSSSSPSNPVVAGSLLFFQANNSTNGAELWKSDGTSGGTVMVSDLVTGSGSSSPANITALGSQVVFSATTSATGVELYGSDGSSVTLISDIQAGTGASSPANFAIFAGKAYFTATRSTTGVELFVTDGTSVGTSLVRDIYAGTTSSSPANLVATSSALYFRATTATQGVEIWKSDGTSAGTVLVKDMALGTLNSTPSSLVALGDSVYFTANDGVTGFDLYQIRGAGEPVRVFDNISQTVSIPSFVEGAGRIYFFGTVGAGVPALLSW